VATPEKPALPKTNIWGRILERFEQNQMLGRLLIVIVFVLATTLILPRVNVQTFRYETGREWPGADLSAPFDFAIRKRDADLRREVQQARSSVPEPYLLDAATVPQVERNVDAYFAKYRQMVVRLRKNVNPASDSNEAVINAVLRSLPPGMEPADLKALAQNPTYIERAQQAARALLRTVYATGYIDREVAQVRGVLLSLRATEGSETVIEKRLVLDATGVLERVDEACEGMPPPVSHMVKTAFAAYAKPNYHFNAKLYEEDLAAAEAAISPYFGKVQAGELIVEHGQRITPEIADKAFSLELQRNQHAGASATLLVVLGQMVCVGIITWITIAFLRYNRREVYGNNRKTALLFFVFFLVTLLNVLTLLMGINLVANPGLNLYYLVPMSMAPIIITVFFDDRVGFFCNVVIAVLSGFVVQNNFELFFIQICAGTVAVQNLTILRKRSQFFTTAGTLLLTYVLTYLGYNLYIQGSFATINYGNLVLFLINVLFTLATYPIIYFFEKLFRLTSDLTYIELLDTDHPLLKELSIKAPGTYQHSLQVANIAEAVANKIAANALQVRVGALFHDIGKVYQPEFFTENQRGGYNPHERLSPQMSAEIIINHVAYGDELAHQHNLPEEIIAFIRTHHGTSRVESFYRRHLHASPDESGVENEFRYKGPLPTTKEMAILMISDSAEAASRSMKNPTPEELKALIERIVSDKISDGQLVQARITFRDVFTIKMEILKILMNIYHTRVEYPDRVPRTSTVDISG